MTKRNCLIFPLVLRSNFRYHYGGVVAGVVHRPLIHKLRSNVMLKKTTLAAISLAFAGGAMAGGYGVVNMDKVVKSVPQVKSMQTIIQKKFQPRQKKLMAMQKKFQALQQKLQKNQAVMSKSALQSAAQDLQKQGQALQVAQMAFQKEATAAQNTAMQKFFNQVKGEAAKIAASKKLDAILPANGLLYSSPSIDYTQQVIDALNK
jgi:outer membrane protein